jgi:hypothetical protein
MKIVFLLIAFSLPIITAGGHQAPSAPAPTNPVDPVTGAKGQGVPIRSNSRSSEANSSIFDDVRAQAAAANSPVLIVSHLGDGEYGQRLHLRRLHNARERFTYSGQAYPRERVAVAAGERVSGRGTIEVFIGCNLRWVVDFERGQDFYVDCCDKFPEYYPWRRARPLVKL